MKYRESMFNLFWNSIIHKINLKTNIPIVYIINLISPYVVLDLLILKNMEISLYVWQPHH
jgi:hypothetical protein